MTTIEGIEKEQKELKEFMKKVRKENKNLSYSEELKIAQKKARELGIY